MDYRVEVLSDVPGLWDADEDALKALAAYFDVVTVTDGYICLEGEPAENLYIIGEGECEVLKRSPKGKTFNVATLTAGCLFGHVGLMTLSTRTASVRANGEVKLLELSGSRARELLRNGGLRITSPLRRALIVALARQVYSATATTMQLAIDAGVATPVEPDATGLPPVPRMPDPMDAAFEEGAAERILEAQSKV